MKKKLKGVYLVISSLVIGLIHIPFSFAKSATGNKVFFTPTKDSTVNSTLTPATPVVKSVYDSLQLTLKGLSQEAFDYAKQGLEKLVAEGKLMNDSIISIIDFSQPSTKKRMYILDLKNYKVLFNTLVAHGRNTGREWATSFSNLNESFKSSPGFFITRETYEGKNGYSLKLAGMERGINDKAYERGIVIHGATYVNSEMANAVGFIGRSHGCPALPTELNRPIINKIKNGTCLFIYHPSYINRSVVLN